MKIVIDGNIGAGKTTLLNKLHNSNKTYNVLLEDVLLWKPWLKLFYKDPKKNSLGFQMRVLLSHLKHINCDISNPKDKYILERSPFTSVYVFGKLLEESGDLSELEYSLCKDYEKKFGWTPDIYIYLYTTPDICYKRIRKRDRDGEESISLDYLTKVHNKYENMFSYLKNKSHKINRCSIYKIDARNSEDLVFQNIVNILGKLL